MSRARNWCFTINNFEECHEHEVFAMSFDSEYTVCGKEVGESGTPHLQGFVCFKTLKSLTQMKDYLPNAHLEVKRGTFKQASDYCKKDQDFYESGTLPMDQKDKGLAEQERWKDAYDCLKEGRLDEMDVQIKCTHLRNLEYAWRREKMDSQDLSIIQGEMEHEWWYGDPGTGKTKKVYEEYPDCYVKDPKERWWDNYTGQEVVCIDDFDKFQVSMGGDMKRWLDRYPFQAPIKGGYITIRPRKIIVTSNYPPDAIWDDEQTQLAIKRRVKITRFHNWPSPALPTAGP